MKRALLAIGLALVAPFVAAAQPQPPEGGSSTRDPESQRKNYEEKLTQGWIKNAPWIVEDYDAARAQAKQRGTVIFTYFTKTMLG